MPELPKLTPAEQRDMLMRSISAIFAKMGVPLADMNVRYGKEELMQAVKENVVDEIVPEVVILALTAGGILGYMAFEAEQN